MNKRRYNVKPPTPDERARLADWLAEWQIDQVLADVDVVDNGATFPGGSSYQAPRAEVGDIWLLGPTAREVRPLYVLLIEAASDEVIWVPFSPYSTPAFPEEWKIGLRAPALRVLCFWNARSVRSRTATPNGWRVKRLTSVQRSATQRVWLWIKGEGTLDPLARNQVGPPLVHPGDPRHRYREQEWERMEDHFRFAAPQESRTESKGPYLAEDSAGMECVLLAAETPGTYGLSHLVFHSQDEEMVFFVYIKNNQVAQIRVTDANGYPCEAGEGGCLVTSEGQQSSHIRSGVSFAPRQYADQWVAFNFADNKRIPVRQLKNIP